MPKPKPTPCPWARTDADLAYHDAEWGVPVSGETHLFEMLTLEGAQAGLSWSTILAKREGYRRAFKGFDPAKVARFTDADRERLLADASIVRNRLKIDSTIDNAQAVLELHRQGTSLTEVLWGFVDGTPIQNHFRALTDLPAQTDLSKAISKDLKRRGFRFVGPTVIYAMMQAIGMTNDHLVTCPRHEPCRDLAKTFRPSAP